MIQIKQIVFYVWALCLIAGALSFQVAPRPILAKKLTTLKASEEPKPFLNKDGLIYDPRTGRFYEKAIEEICRDEFCTVDEKTGEPVMLTVKEKERIFLDSLQAYYYDGRNVLTDDDFDKLKADLIWEGSPLATLSRDETLFLNAMSAYMKGNPIISDAEFDELKKKLMEVESPIAVSTEPRCYIETGVCKVTFVPDTPRILTLYTPAFLIATLLWVGVTYEVFEFFRALNPLVTFIAGSPLIYAGTKVGTENFWLKDPLIAKGPCPKCGFENRIYFGTILGVEGVGEAGDVNCPNCKTLMTVEKRTLKVVADLN
mmetsp:Transcript_24131/g.31303  ORF Transcript_24131/g.31303 Transcript_24131/m.31303 type:complete len:315 (-) Transcript_24131:525-1469(-)|eukprot:CAMPEP_0117735320 /NCGR_PEP_ID=MMETSP0947-20121206/1235_1 /TAXON_ID=44440 /ORGANISM="Chattonella subsalsa, Strain CCMP2191" /LENGTH=314 /DNA_ID=CAMNT_0005550339 /DNA_START=107 /DNA_END=1051 /DNA_ORIENTATION=-